MEKRNDDPRNVGKVITVLVYGTVGIIFLLQAGKSLYLGQQPSPGVLLGCICTGLTVLGTVSGDKPRRVVGTIWIGVALLGLLFLVLGAGLDIVWMLDKSIGMLFIGLITARLVFLPDDMK